jgi:hypothetical protein
MPFDEGGSRGKLRPEPGTTLLDDAHGDGARITLESGANVAPFAVPCGVSGWMVHTIL